jgi:ABC-type amino acid transport substrate-binding protein
LLAVVLGQAASAGTLERIHETNRIRIGYSGDARPFSYRTQTGDVDGYAAVLCKRVVEELKRELSLPNLQISWIPVSVTFGYRLKDVEQEQVDLLCSPAVATLGRREMVAFSVPIFPGGVRAVVRSDAAPELRQALGDTPNVRPIWRGSPATKLLSKTSFTVVSDTTSQVWLAERLQTFQIDAKTTVVPSYKTGLQQLVDRKTDVFFGDRAIVLASLNQDASRNVVVLDRLLTQEPYALALARNDDDFRLIVDKALSHFYKTNEFFDLYRKWFGEFDDNTRRFFAWSTPSD